MKKWCLFVAAAAVAVSTGPAFADPVAGFYKGKRTKIIIRTGAGTGYDLYSRLLARHIVRHVPGGPTGMLPINMPGGGGMRAANYMAEVAPQDGSVIAMLNSGVVMVQAMNLNKSLKADFRTFNWIGNLNSSNQLLAVWHTSPTKTLDDAMKRETLIGTTGAGSIGLKLAAVSNNVIGTKFKIIFGYSGMGALNLGMERGEIEGRATSPYSSYAAKTAYIRDKSINFLLQFGLKPDPHVPDVPLARNLGKTPESKAILEFVSAAVAVGWPTTTSPGVPKERVAALRSAFDKTLKDPKFIAEAKRLNAEINPMTGAEVEETVNSVLNAPEDIRNKAREAMLRSGAKKVAKKGGKKDRKNSKKK